MSNEIAVKFQVDQGDRSVGIYESWGVMIEFGRIRIFAGMLYNEPVEDWPVTEVQKRTTEKPDEAWGVITFGEEIKLGIFEDAIVKRVKQMHEIREQDAKCEILLENCGWGINSYIDSLEWDKPEGWEQQVKELRMEAGRACGQFKSAQRKLSRLLAEAGVEDSYDLVEVI